VSAKITFLARHYPPSPAINGESVCDMVQYLQDKFNVECNVICLDREFEGGGQRRQPSGNVLRLKTLYQGRNAAFRFVTFLYDGFVLAREALKYNDTLIICTTSPPMLPFWAAMLFGKNVRWGFWTFDLFPEGFHANNLIGDNNLFYKWVMKITYGNVPSFLITLGPKQAEHLQQQYHKPVPSITLPCGVFFYQDKSTVIPHWKEEGKIYFGYCGNLSDPHNPDFLKAAIDSIDASRHRLVLALYGNQAAAIKEYAAGKHGVIIVDNVPRSQLHFIDVHLVSLRKEWTHIAVPSKAISAVMLGSAILFCGSEQSDNWHLLQNAGWLIDEDADLKSELKKLVDSISHAELIKRKEATATISEKLKDDVINAYEAMAKKVE